jgi:hypothetical protein
VRAGTEGAIEQNTVTSTTYRPNGSMVTMTGKGVDGDVLRTTNLLGFYMPEKPIKVGDTWEYELKADEATKRPGLKASYKVEAFEKLGSFDTVRIKQSLKETSGAAPSSLEGPIWISSVDGTLVKLEGVWKSAPLSAEGVDAKILIAREEVKG